jgi:hypothetical protein
MARWATFASITGTAAAALLGLLFVAVSIKITVIAIAGAQHNRASQMLFLFMVVPVIAALTGGVASAWLLLTRIPE